MVFLRRWLRLPSPVDLGWSKTDALGMRRFTPYQEGKTWEDWHEYVQIRYPIRYFLAEAVPEWGKHWLIWPIRRFWAWLLDYLLPSRRYHLLDLRGVDPLSSYRHGYLDPCEMFRLAGWAALMRWHRESGSRQWVDQRERYREAAELILYWTVTRIQRQARHAVAAVGGAGEAAGAQPLADLAVPARESDLHRALRQLAAQVEQHVDARRVDRP